jgi:hypothetical protein
MDASTSNTKESTLRWLVAHRAEALRELMEGESRYTLPHSIGISEANREEGRAWTMALYHVRYAARFGLAQQRVVEGTYVHSAFPEDFERWLGMGAPGISEEELGNYLRDQPIPCGR